MVHIPNCLVQVLHFELENKLTTIIALKQIKLETYCKHSSPKIIRNPYNLRYMLAQLSTYQRLKRSLIFEFSPCFDKTKLLEVKSHKLSKLEKEDINSEIKAIIIYILFLQSI